MIGRIVALTVDGIMAQVSISIGGQRITSVITADAVREMRLRVGQHAAALIKSTEVMILRVLTPANARGAAFSTHKTTSFRLIVRRFRSS